ncbi:MAG: type I secretion system permease/ATPase [Pseudomonadota bacterium]
MTEATGRDGSSEGEEGLEEPLESLVEAFLRIARHYDLPFSDEHVRLAAEWGKADYGRAGMVRSVARQLDLDLQPMEGLPAWGRVSEWQLPLVVELRDGRFGVLVARNQGARFWRVGMAGDGEAVTEVDDDRLRGDVVRTYVARPRRNRPDSRVDDYIEPEREHWFRSIVFARLAPYGHVMLASLLANSLSLAGLIFAMQVYDRVIPAESFPTLYVLFSGVVLALLFEFFMRISRVRLIDAMGKSVDLRVSDRVFDHALRLKSTARPRATGTFISQLREIESVRELMTSSTVSVVADLPFFLLFSLVFWYVAGWLVVVPVIALLVMVTPGLLLQRRLGRLARESMRESSIRNGMLVESVQGGDEIKMLQAESHFANRWNHFTAVVGEANLRLRSLTGTLSSWGQVVQTGTFAVVVLFGAPLVMEGEITTGVLVAASILASRMLAPMAQLNQVLGRWQQARVALKALDEIMARPVDRASGRRYVHRGLVLGEYRLTGARFGYADDDSTAALAVDDLSIDPGERIAVVGRSGAGKSTLLAGLAGLLPARSGKVVVDGVNLQDLDPSDLRRDVGLLTQGGRLFHGTLRENLRLAVPNATDGMMLEALSEAGMEALVTSVPGGLDYMIQEGGRGLSGGQRQGVLLARVLLRSPRVLLLDEPTTGMDETAESTVIDRLAALPAGHTVIMATHRKKLLQNADRVIVLDGGKVVLDGEREHVLNTLSGKRGGRGRR